MIGIQRERYPGRASPVRCRPLRGVPPILLDAVCVAMPPLKWRDG